MEAGRLRPRGGSEQEGLNPLSWASSDAGSHWPLPGIDRRDEELIKRQEHPRKRIFPANVQRVYPQKRTDLFSNSSV